jgi:malonyl-CoA O-methyltransferase
MSTTEKMITGQDLRKVRKAFSSSARKYEALSGLQKEVGRRLLAHLTPQEKALSLLDLGAGTGWLTRHLKGMFPSGNIFVLDSAVGMAEQARKQDASWHVVAADALALPFRPAMFDLIISNLVYQWVADLSKAFRESAGCLRNGGTFCFSMFGQRTLEELFQSLAAVLATRPDRLVPGARRLPDFLSICDEVSRAGLMVVEKECRFIQVPFDDMLSLVQWLKDIGANALERDFYVGRKLLFKANEYYNRHFQKDGQVYATFEVIAVKATKSKVLSE